MTEKNNEEQDKNIMEVGLHSMDKIVIKVKDDDDNEKELVNTKG